MTGSDGRIRRRIKLDLVRDLLACARERVDDETGRPRQVVLRRAVSDAYYALFHAICYVAAEGTVGWVPWERFEPLYRSIDHLETKRRFESADLRGIDPDVKRVGEIFGDLLKERHRADYDPRPFARSKAETAVLIALAETAIEAIEGLPDAAYQRLAVSLIAKPRRS